MNVERFIIWAAGIYAAAYLLRRQTISLKYFKPTEFGAWFPLMDRELLLKLDTFRAEYGKPIKVSPVAGALGRPDSPSSQHFPDPMVKAVDIIFTESAPDFQRAFDVAKRVGFTGIGVYRDWNPYGGMHLDVRDSRAVGDPAKWAGVPDGDGQKYVSISEAGIRA